MGAGKVAKALLGIARSKTETVNAMVMEESSWGEYVVGVMGAVAWRLENHSRQLVLRQKE